MQKHNEESIELHQMSPREKAVEMMHEIQQLGIKYGLNITVYRGEIGFVDQEHKKIVALWRPEFKIPIEDEVEEK